MSQLHRGRSPEFLRHCERFGGIGLRVSGVFTRENEPSIRTLREWTKLRRVPYYRPDHFVSRDPAGYSR